MLEIHIENSLEPITVREPMQASLMNISAAANQGIRFFLTHDLEGNDVAVNIAKVIYLREIEDD